MEGRNEVVVVPKELQVEILLRMPLKSILKFICVSKTWASIICGKHFKNLHFKRSMKRPRVLFAFRRELYGPNPELLFHFVYQEEEPSWLFGQHKMFLSVEPEHNDISEPIRGLISLKSRTKIVLCNPGIKKSRTLPEFGGRNNVSCLKSLFGYDKDAHVFKVLCSTTTRAYDVSWALPVDLDELSKMLCSTSITWLILTVGSGGEESWRPVECNYLHHPISNGLCKGGVVYYGAWIEPDKRSILMSFNVSSERFTIINELPAELNIYGSILVKYNKNLALVKGPVSDQGEMEIWVWNDMEWQLKTIVIPSWRETVIQNEREWQIKFFFIGSIGTRTLVYAPKAKWTQGSNFVVYYDPVTENLRKFEIQGVDGDPSFLLTRTFVNHADSLWLAEGTNYSFGP